MVQLMETVSSNLFASLSSLGASHFSRINFKFTWASLELTTYYTLPFYSICLVFIGSFMFYMCLCASVFTIAPFYFKINHVSLRLELCVFTVVLGGSKL